MKLLVVGSGGREQALALGLGASPSRPELLFAPGNPGTAALGRNLPIGVLDIAGLVSAARREEVGLVVVGPEAPLALGLADALAGAGLPCFGPGARAARIESSKAFSKAFMARQGIPTAEARIFREAGAALAYAKSLPRLPVIKASGLAAGKGVVLPENDAALEAAVVSLLALGGPGSELLVEERLEGEELSLIAVSDGHNWVLLPPARDHKRLSEGDRGPNTGGMGSYAPAASMESARRLAELVIGPAIEGLEAEGTPFVGALFAGLMLTAAGPKVLEYNCRLGDPEAQAILPLLEDDLLDLLLRSATGRLGGPSPRWKGGSAACVVLASEGYPEAPGQGRAIGLPPELPRESWLLHAGTRVEGGRLLSAGGRVLNAVALGADLDEALSKATALAGRVDLEGSVFRRDIGAKGSLQAAALASLEAAGERVSSAYARAGVDIDAGNRSVELMKEAVRSTYGPEVLAGIGSFGGLYEASALKTMTAPVLVASTDGVGTKTSLGLALGRPRGLGIDMVNHSIDDILVQGARPLFFLDYVAASRLVPETVAEIVAGMAEACRAAGCALLGGETAEMPGTYREGELDIAGTIVGSVDKGAALPRLDLAEGDLVVAFASSGLHTNGYSLARRALEGLDLEAFHPLLGESPAEALLRPHRSYLGLLGPALSAKAPPIKALAHITGGGFVENIPRVLPAHLDAVIEGTGWAIPPIFRLIQERAAVSAGEMARVFNLGVGMIALVDPGRLGEFLSLLPREEPYAEFDGRVIGRLVAGRGRTLLA